MLHAARELERGVAGNGTFDSFPCIAGKGGSGPVGGSVGGARCTRLFVEHRKDAEYVFEQGIDVEQHSSRHVVGKGTDGPQATSVHR